MLRFVATAAVFLCLGKYAAFGQNATVQAPIAPELAKLANGSSLELLLAEEEAIRQAVANVADSVVQIETFGGAQLVDEALVTAGPFTGTVVGGEGWIITSSFTVRNNPASITAVLPDGSRKAATITARDYSRELVLLKVAVDSPLKPIVVAEGSPAVGQWAIAVGKTFDPATPTQSVGIVSALGRVWSKAIQTDAKISPFNYGGPLIDIRGRALGILTPISPGIATEGTIEQWYDSGIGFAIDIASVMQRLPRLQKGEDIHNGLFGLRAKSRDDFKRVVQVAGILPGFPTAKAGMQSGDQIIAIDGEPVLYYNNLKHLLGPIDAGRKVTVTIRRGDQTLDLEMVGVEELPTYRRPFLGVAVRQSSDPAAIEINAVEPGSPAQSAGLLPGDLITRYNDREPATLDAWRDAIDYTSIDEPVTLEITRGGETQKLTIDATAWPSPSELEPLPLEAVAVADEVTRPTGELPLADVPNKSVYLGPREDSDRPLGLLMIAVDSAATLDAAIFEARFGEICDRYGYIVAAISPAEDGQWQPDEQELFSRGIAFLSEEFSLDTRRIVVSGGSAGSRVAARYAVENVDTVRGLFFAGDQLFNPAALPPAEPQATLDILLPEEIKGADRFQQAIEDRGNRVLLYTESPDFLLQEPADTLILDRYLATLLWY